MLLFTLMFFIGLFYFCCSLKPQIMSHISENNLIFFSNISVRLFFASLYPPCVIKFRKDLIDRQPGINGIKIHHIRPFPLFQSSLQFSIFNFLFNDNPDRWVKTFSRKSNISQLLKTRSNVCFLLKSFLHLQTTYGHITKGQCQSENSWHSSVLIASFKSFSKCFS